MRGTTRSRRFPFGERIWLEERRAGLGEGKAPGTVSRSGGTIVRTRPLQGGTGLTNLQILELFNTKVTDAELKELAALTNLQQLVNQVSQLSF